MSPFISVPCESVPSKYGELTPRHLAPGPPADGVLVSGVLVGMFIPNRLMRGPVLLRLAFNFAFGVGRWEISGERQGFIVEGTVFGFRVQD
jgi:hypothetical protein